MLCNLQPFWTMFFLLWVATTSTIEFVQIWLCTSLLQVFKQAYDQKQVPTIFSFVTSINNIKIHIFIYKKLQCHRQVMPHLLMIKSEHCFILCNGWYILLSIYCWFPNSVTHGIKSHSKQGKSMKCIKDWWEVAAWHGSLPHLVARKQEWIIKIQVLSSSSKFPGGPCLCHMAKNIVARPQCRATRHSFSWWEGGYEIEGMEGRELHEQPVQSFLPLAYKQGISCANGPAMLKTCQPYPIQR